MSDALKQTIESLNEAFEKFKVHNDARLKEIETKGAASGETIAAVERSNAAITALQAKLEEDRQALREVETAVARLDLSPRDQRDQERMHAERFFAQVKGKDAAVDLDAYRAYKSALNTYMRRGPDAITPDVRAALSVGSDPAGGYWVTPDVGGKIVELIYETSPVRQIADVQTIGTDALEGRYDLDEADSGWVGEQGTRSETDTPEVGKWRIEAHEQYAEPKTTQKNLDDSSLDVEGWLARKVADKLSRRENTAFVSGTGVLKPRGFLTYTAGTPSASTFNVIEQVASGASGAFAASDPGDKLIDLVFALKAAYRQNAAFGMSRTTVAEVRKLKDGQDNYLWAPNFSERQGGMLLGYPIVEMEDMPAIAADSLSIVFGDFRAAYQIVDRQGIRVLRDPLTSKGFVKFYTTKRVGGAVVNFEALKIMKFAA